MRRGGKRPCVAKRHRANADSLTSSIHNADVDDRYDQVLHDGSAELERRAERGVLVGDLLDEEFHRVFGIRRSLPKIDVEALLRSTASPEPPALHRSAATFEQTYSFKWRRMKGRVTDSPSPFSSPLKVEDIILMRQVIFPRPAKVERNSVCSYVRCSL